MSNRDVKKDHLLDAGLSVMKSQGYHGTSVKDIVDAAGVPKGSFYNYFPSKEAFTVEAIEKAAGDAKHESQRLLSNSSLTPIARLEQHFSQQVSECCEGEFTAGCFLGNMCQEMADSSDLIRAKLQHAMRDNTVAIEQLISDGISNGSIAADVDAALMAEFLCNAWQGAMMRMKASKCREPLDAFMTQLPRLLLK